METNKHIFRVDRWEINYLRVTVESYDGLGVVSTVDPRAAIIKVQVSPGCEDLFSQLVASLVEDEGMHLLEEIREPV